ncbi:MAG: CoA protein activase [Chloroflexota bacterium]|jgi:predicted nucleotide-binding protein (sugar kinase/HSP70/actin superfamily)
MKVTFPHAGQAWVPLSTVFAKAGVECIVAPPSSKRTLSLGVKYSPEWVCLPFKLNLGNFIEAMELGADTLVYVAGPGLCRLGYYAKVAEQILRDAGYQFQMVTFDWQEKQIIGLAEFLRTLLPNRSWRQIVADIKFGLTQLSVMDELERKAHYLRPRVTSPTQITQIWRTAGQRVAQAWTDAELTKVKAEILREFDDVPKNPKADPLRVGLLGEFFMVIEPFVNMDVEDLLGRMGVEVVRHAFFTNWAKTWLFLEAIGLGHDQKVKKAAAPYLSRDVSGDAIFTIGETILHHKDGFDGIVHLLPFTCMPEIIAQSIMPQVTKNHEIPVLSVVLDEQMGRAGFITRIEAFVDLMQRRRNLRKAG